MRKPISIFITLLFTSISFGQTVPLFSASDIENFWIAYEKITSTTDSLQQQNYLQHLYIDKATPGLKNLIEVRRYTNKEFIDAINQYPKFWNSFRANTTNLNKIYPDIEADIQKLRTLYPTLKPATIYFLIGAFRTNGTTKDNRILIGSELALADSTTIVDELPLWRQQFYRDYNPKKNIALLCTHEYIHTQQKPLVENLLSMCVYEGVAEFISCKATGKPSFTPAIAFGKANQDKVVKQFVTDLFLMSNDNNWLWGENKNELKLRDLGYFIGYEICERYYNLSANKLQAIKELIELDYTNEKEVERIVDATKLLPGTLLELSKDYERQRPTVVSLKPFKNAGSKVKPGLCQITLTFSQPMDTKFRGFNYGPLGEGYIYKFLRIIGWSDDKKSFTYEVELLPDRHYQFLVTNSFRNEKGIRLKPYLVEFRTKK